jgi:hypothetical protein
VPLAFSLGGGGHWLIGSPAGQYQDAFDFVLALPRLTRLVRNIAIKIRLYSFDGLMRGLAAMWASAAIVFGKHHTN